MPPTRTCLFAPWQHTDLLGLQPLPITALQDETLEALYAPQFMHFNPIQTQIFHTLYHTDGNVLLGAPTGSGTHRSDYKGRVIAVVQLIRMLLRTQARRSPRKSPCGAPSESTHRPR